MKSTRILSNRIFTVMILGFCAAISLGGYLLASDLVFRTGFPLDDAWIHQTYARNLGVHGTWEFIPGQPSAGSTAPGWTLILALGYWLNLSPRIWTYFLGWLLLLGLALTAASGFKLILPDHTDLSILAGLMIIFEWHLVWAAGSGMETLLVALIALQVILWLIHLEEQSEQGEKSLHWEWFGLGLLVGLSIWIRPDGITLLAIAGLTLVLIKRDLGFKIRAGSIVGAGFLLTSLPYLYFNLTLAGEIWPNTFYAKQAEYAILRTLPLWQRIVLQVRQPLTGVGIVLLPGFVWFSIASLRKRKWAQVFSVLWVLGYMLVYAIRLPVTYQHGRYVIPIIPVLCLFGIIGIVWLVALLQISKWGRILRISWIAVVLIIILAFWILGFQAYAADVAIIESEMVEVSHWIAENTEIESLVAAHDIGALGYYAQRELLDLAGLVSPEVIPFIRDEDLLRRYITDSGAEYLVTFPGWYPELIDKSDLLYQTDGEFSPKMGGENMSVFKWDQPK
jgi:hypothetical protein